MNKLPPWRRNQAPYAASGFCSNERLREAREFFTEQADALPGSDLALGQTLESIELCIALKAAKGAEISGWLDEQF